MILGFSARRSKRSRKLQICRPQARGARLVPSRTLRSPLRPSRLKALDLPPVEQDLEPQRTQREPQRTERENESLPLQDLFQSILEIRMLKLIFRGHELGWFYALAAEKELFAHLSEY